MAENSKLNVGLFGGSFDPIHFGHLNLAIEMLEKRGLDKILFCPAAQNPFKKTSDTQARDRLAMVELAIAEIPAFEVITLEIEREGPSFTVDTLEILAREYSNLFLILGEDSFSQFDQWKKSDRILELATLLVAPRESDGGRNSDLRVMQISSTDIRRRISDRLYCGHLAPKIVLDYIQDHQLYSSTHEKK